MESIKRTAAIGDLSSAQYQEIARPVARLLIYLKAGGLGKSHNVPMNQMTRLQSLGLLDARVPRYTSYPTAPFFSGDVGETFQAHDLSRLDPSEAVSVYLHIPFCERLCWFCACRTQGTKTLHPVERYVETVEREIALLSHTLPSGLRMARLHWGGGTPTILPADLIRRLAAAIKRAIPPTGDWEFSVEIDPMMIDGAKIDALASEGMRRASIGIQDFDPEVQTAIGRVQPYEATSAVVDDLRRAGVTSLNTDLVYGLPHQTMDRLKDTVEKVIGLAPDRVALFGYAHVPWMSKRQKLIDEAALPDNPVRYRLAEAASRMFAEAGMAAIGIDHFALPSDELCQAAVTGTLRRNFQGYTADQCPVLIGLGASSISRLPSGYVQNASATAAYSERIENGMLAGARGHVFTDEDRLRGRAIEMLMCDGAIDRTKLNDEFGMFSETLNALHAQVAQTFGDFVEVNEAGVRIRENGRPLTRIVASTYDAYAPDVTRYSLAC